MKLFSFGKDGGPESSVSGFWFIEWKRLFSIALLRFDGDSREAYHTHAFNSVSWVLKGMLSEEVVFGPPTLGARLFRPYFPSIVPVFTSRKRMHKVSSLGRTWVLTFRGPWAETWSEYLPCNCYPWEGHHAIGCGRGRVVTLSDGRRQLGAAVGAQA